MKQRKMLTTEERGFFTLVSEAAFANPFSRERNELDRQIAGVSGPEPSREEMITLVTVRVAEQLKRLEQTGRADVRLYEGRDREVVRMAFLFNVYLRYRR